MRGAVPVLIIFIKISRGYCIRPVNGCPIGFLTAQRAGRMQYTLTPPQHTSF